jgi:hypothetical protein
VRPREWILRLHPTVSAYDSLTVVVRSDSVFMREQDWFCPTEDVLLSLCFFFEMSLLLSVARGSFLSCRGFS